jgi:hypothetical protein
MRYKCLCNIIPNHGCYQTLRATRRRQRKADPLASRETVCSVIEKLRSALPDLIPQKEIEELLKASEPILAILNRIQRRKEQTKVIKVKLWKPPVQ